MSRHVLSNRNVLSAALIVPRKPNNAIRVHKPSRVIDRILEWVRASITREQSY